MHHLARLHRTRAVYPFALLAVTCAAVAQQNIGELIAALSSEDAAARQLAIERATPVGPAAIIAIAPLLDDDRPGAVNAAGEAIGRIVEAAMNEDESRKGAMNALAIAALATKNRNPLIEQLGKIGDIESLPVLVNLLDEAPLSFEAALDAITRVAVDVRTGGEIAGTTAVCRALVDRLDRFEGRQRGRIMRTAGLLGCGGIEDRLIDEVRARTPASEDAAAALGESGGEAALDPLWFLVEKAGSRTALDACLQILARLPEKRAVTWYTDLLDRTPARLRLAPDDVSRIADPSIAARVVCVLVEGIGRTSTSEETVDLLLPYLDAKETDVQRSARDALIALKANGATERLIKKARKSSETRTRSLTEIIEMRQKCEEP